MDIPKIRNSVETVLRKHDLEPAHTGIQVLVDTWEGNKSNLIELLRKHPNWDEDAMAVKFDYDSLRNIDVDLYNGTFCAVLRKFRQHLNSKNIDASEDPVYRKLLSLYDLCRGTQFVTENIKSILTEILGVKVNIGQKISRLINAEFIKAGIPEIIGAKEYNSLFGQLADAVNPLKITRHTLLSVHPCDYLHMSYGGNLDGSSRWQSCHNIEDGCYKGGTLSYMQDSSSMIFYTVERTYMGDEFWAQRRVNRQVYAYGNNALLQSRLYPSYTDEENILNFRNAVQSIMAVCLNAPNLWILKKSMSEIKEICCTDDKALHYKDYEYEDYRASVSLLKGAESHGPIYIGHSGTCICCGDSFSDSGELTCDDCNGRHTCYECGCEIDEDEGHEIDGYWYCEDCCNYCDHCESWHTEESTECRDENGHWINVCESCLDYNYIRCEHCEDYWHADAVQEVSGYGDVCSRCIERSGDFAVCVDCGETFCISDLTYDEASEGYYCEDCYKERESEIESEDDVA